MQTKIGTMLLLLVAAIAGCGDELIGTYADDADVTRYSFLGDGAVTILVLGSKVDAEYRLDGDKILVSSAQGTVILTRRDDRLYGPMGLELIRQSE